MVSVLLLSRHRTLLLLLLQELLNGERDGLRLPDRSPQGPRPAMASGRADPSARVCRLLVWFGHLQAVFPPAGWFSRAETGGRDVVVGVLL